MNHLGISFSTKAYLIKKSTILVLGILCTMSFLPLAAQDNGSQPDQQAKQNGMIIETIQINTPPTHDRPGGGGETTRLLGRTPKQKPAAVMNANGDSYLLVPFEGKIEVSGMALASHGGLDFYLAKYLADGSLDWLLQFGGAYNDVPFRLIQNSVGDLIIVGDFFHKLEVSGQSVQTMGDRDVLLATISEAGDIKWLRALGGAGDQMPVHVSLGAEDRLALMARSHTDETKQGNTETGIIFAQIDSWGEAIWSSGHTEKDLQGE